MADRAGFSYFEQGFAKEQREPAESSSAFDFCLSFSTSPRVGEISGQLRRRLGQVSMPFDLNVLKGQIRFSVRPDMARVRATKHNTD